MNKYIITHEKIKMQNREEQDFIVSALYNQGKKMIEVSITPPDEDSLLGNIYIGRVENVVQNIRAPPLCEANSGGQPSHISF